MKMQMIAAHINKNLAHSSALYQGKLRSLISFIGRIPITVGKIAPIHHRSARCTAVLREKSKLEVRNVTAATIAKLKKIRICDAVLFSSLRRRTREFNRW